MSPTVALIAHQNHCWKMEPLAQRFGSDSVVVSVESLLAGEILPATVTAAYHKVRRPDALRAIDKLELLGVQTLNTAAAVRTASNRSDALQKAMQAGVRTADQFFGPLADVPFAKFIVKDAVDDHRSKMVTVRDESQRQELLARGFTGHVYAQRLMETRLELKVYVIGRRVHGFMQAPRHIDGNKLNTRRTWDPPARIAREAIATADAIGLEVAGIDFLVEKGVPRLTDVNSSQSLWRYDACLDDLSSLIWARAFGHMSWHSKRVWSDRRGI